VKHEVVLAANDDPADNFLTFINTETYSIIGTTHKLDGTDPNFQIKLTGVTLPTHSRWRRTVSSSASSTRGRGRTIWLSRRLRSLISTSRSVTPNPSPGPGVVLKISRHAPFHIEETITIPTSTGCTGPQGLAIGPRHEMQLGCGARATNSIIIDDRSGPTATVARRRREKAALTRSGTIRATTRTSIARSGAGKLGVEDAEATSPGLPSRRRRDDRHRLACGRC